jgi:hypothetical protein
MLSGKAWPNWPFGLESFVIPEKDISQLGLQSILLPHSLMAFYSVAGGTRDHTPLGAIRLALFILAK